MAIKAGKDINTDRVLQQEFCPVPLSMAIPDCRLQGLPQDGMLFHLYIQLALLLTGWLWSRLLEIRHGAKTFGEWNDGVAGM